MNGRRRAAGQPADAMQARGGRATGGLPDVYDGAAGELDSGALRHPKKSALLEAYGRLGNITEAAAAAEIDRTMHYYWLNHDPAYRAAFLDAYEAYCDRLQGEIRSRAVDGWDEPIFNKDGEQVGSRKKKSDLLLIFEAKGRMPDIYRDNAPLPVENPGTEAVRRQLDRLSVEQLRALLAKFEAGELPNDVSVLKELPPPDDEA